MELVKIAFAIHNLVFEHWGHVKEQLEGIDTMVFAGLLKTLTGNFNEATFKEDFFRQVEDYLDKINDVVAQAEALAEQEEDIF